MKEDLPWVFVAAILIAVTVMLMWYRSPTKHAVRLQKEESETSEEPKEDPPKENPVFYRRYHHWSSPSLTADSTLTATVDKCEEECSSDKTCFGITHDGLTKRCGKLSRQSFDGTLGLVGEYVDSNEVITSMKDQSLKVDHLDCFGPYKRKNPNRISPSQCPRSREAAINSYFQDIPQLSVFGSMLPGGTHEMMKVQFRAR